MVKLLESDSDEEGASGDGLRLTVLVVVTSDDSDAEFEADNHCVPVTVDVGSDEGVDVWETRNVKVSFELVGDAVFDTVTEVVKLLEGSAVRLHLVKLTVCEIVFVTVTSLEGVNRDIDTLAVPVVVIVASFETVSETEADRVGSCDVDLVTVPLDKDFDKDCESVLVSDTSVLFVEESDWDGDWLFVVDT